MKQTKKQIMDGVQNVEKSRIVANNTVKYTDDRGEHVRLHNTDIISFIDGKTILNTGGWRTPTTKSRINDFLSKGHVYQEKSVWYLTYNQKSYVFEDGITIHKNGKVGNYGKDASAYHKLNKQIGGYVKGYIKELFAGNVPAPSGGDCWLCCMVDKETGKPMKGSDHLISHIKEKYYVPSLLINAEKEFPVSILAKSVISDIWSGKTDQLCMVDFTKRQLTSSLRRYMKRQLNMAA